MSAAENVGVNQNNTENKSEELSKKEDATNSIEHTK